MANNKDDRIRDKSINLYSNMYVIVFSRDEYCITVPNVTLYSARKIIWMINIIIKTDLFPAIFFTIFALDKFLFLYILQSCSLKGGKEMKTGILVLGCNPEEPNFYDVVLGLPKTPGTLVKAVAVMMEENPSIMVISGLMVNNSA